MREQNCLAGSPHVELATTGSPYAAFTKSGTQAIGFFNFSSKHLSSESLVLLDEPGAETETGAGPEFQDSAGLNLSSMLGAANAAETEEWLVEEKITKLEKNRRHLGATKTSKIIIVFFLFLTWIGSSTDKQNYFFEIETLLSCVTRYSVPNFLWSRFSNKKIFIHWSPFDRHWGEEKQYCSNFERERERDDDALLLFLANSTKGSSDERVSPEDTSL